MGDKNEQSDIIRTDLFTLQVIPGKGKGLIASQTILPGTCLISEKPLFTTADIQSSDVERELMRIVKGLSKDEQRAFLSLHNNNPGREPFSNIVRSNGYPLGPSSDVGGIFPNIARINHSCLANTQQAWSTSRAKETAYAVRRIEPGQEITIAYNIGGPSHERKSKLKEYFGFDCHCEMCSLSGEKLRASDARQIKARQLDESIGSPKRVKMTPEKALLDCRDLLKVYQEDGVADSRLPRLYYDAFQICAMHGDQARARIFAQRCAEARKICEGNDSTDAAEMLAYAAKPSAHESFGGSSKWKLAVDGIPQNLEGRSLETWLWREK